ncbi:hypothetical protein D3C71_1147580 [compost metagenome]
MPVPFQPFKSMMKEPNFGLANTMLAALMPPSCHKFLAFLLTRMVNFKIQVLLQLHQKTVYLLITMPTGFKVYSEKETGHGYPAQDLRAIPTDPMQDWHATAMAQMTLSVTDGPMVPNPYIMKQLMVISGV